MVSAYTGQLEDDWVGWDYRLFFVARWLDSASCPRDCACWEAADGSVVCSSWGTAVCNHELDREVELPKWRFFDTGGSVVVERAGKESLVTHDFEKPVQVGKGMNVPQKDDRLVGETFDMNHYSRMLEDIDYRNSSEMWVGKNMARYSALDLSEPSREAVVEASELNNSERAVVAASELVVDDAETVGKTESGDSERFESHTSLYHVAMNC